MSRIRLSAAVWRTRKSRGSAPPARAAARPARLGASRESRGPRRSVRPRSPRWRRSGPAASSKPTSWEKSPSGPISTLTRPSKRPCGSRSACGVAVAVGARRRTVRRDRPARALGQLLHPAAHLDRLAQRLHPDPRRLAAGLRLDLLQSRRDRLQRGDAAVVALVRLAQPLGEAADLALALDHHPGEGGKLPLEPVDRSASSARPRPRPAAPAADPRVPRRDRRVHIEAAVAEEHPLEATHARHRKGAFGRHFVTPASTRTAFARRQALAAATPRACRSPAPAAAPRARGPRARSAPAPRR